MLIKDAKFINIWKPLAKESNNMNNELEIRDLNFSSLL